MILNTYNVTVRVILSVALWLFLPTFSQAQVSILATDQIVQPNQVFTVDIKGVGFTDILTCQFSVTWDSTAFQFLSTGNLNPAFEDYPLEHFGMPANGTLGFSWIDFSLAGIALVDSSTLFSLQFKAIQEESGEYAIGFAGFPTAIEVADIDENILTVEFHEGNIRIDGVSGLLPQNASEYVTVNCAPNPFREQTQVQLDFLRSTSARISINGPNGALLFEEQDFFSAGLNTLNFSKDVFSQAGVYLLTIQSKDFLVTRKLIAL
ncbi:MAG: T9SS type A sorting domain-containing protein [Phaeodactylibacter sp.]|nr:T9SS type A sorting domain-containing protein [Phaeodactylibacter sp.]MCB9299301.1 T9SS type A sorting domain-containing protein [Lewinellaceae bacterium]